MSNRFINVGGKEFEFVPGAGGVAYFADQVYGPGGTDPVTTKVRRCWFSVFNERIRTQDELTGHLSGHMGQELFLRHYGNTPQDALALGVVGLDEVIGNLNARIEALERRKAELNAVATSYTQKELF